MPSQLRVKFILPALTEATSPYWRPIKYSLFPPLGLATLAAYLAPDDEAVIVDEHVQPLDTERPARPGRHPGLHHQRVPRVSHRRSLPGEGQLRGARRTPRDLAAGRGAGARRRDLSRSGRADVPAVPGGVPRRPGAADLPIDVGADAGACPADSTRSDRPPPLSRAELHRRHARLPAALRLLLQGCVLHGRTIVLHPARRRGARRNFTAARTPSVFPGRPSARRPRASPRRCSTACAG